ncbi:MAG: hypothetical protein WCG92_14385 [Hyphomicrobiales bacterium]
MSSDEEPSRHTVLKEAAYVDSSAAISAFYRLHMYAVHFGKLPMAIFAAYKALQKLEQLHAEAGLKSSPLPIDGWVRAGLWLALETYLVAPQQPGITDKKQIISFKRALENEWNVYRRWFALTVLMEEKNIKLDAAAHLLAVPGAQWRTQRRAFEYVEKIFSDANSPEFDGDDDQPRALIKSRDMSPTQRLLSIFNVPPNAGRSFAPPTISRPTNTA